MDFKHRFVETGGIRMHVAEAGAGPLVVLCHGFPESWYSWRHQLVALAEAGYHAVAPDMRGYGKTDRPEAIDQYSLLHLVGDLVGLLDALGERTAVVVGHDWGAPVAWHAALLRPDRFRGVVGLSVPFRPRGSVPPTTRMPQSADAVFYQLYFQEPGVAEAEFERDPQATIQRMLLGGSGQAGGDALGMVARGGGFLDFKSLPASLPMWISRPTSPSTLPSSSERASAVRSTGTRNIDRNWELLAPWKGAPITVPALYVAGDRDMVVRFPGMDRLLPTLKDAIPKLQGTILLPGCGHWTQQERPGEVNAALLEFLKTLDAPQ